MVEGLILAAGSSKRAGGFKPELHLGTQTVLEHSVAGMYNVCARIIVVGGYRVERVREILSPYSKVEVVENKDWQRGMFSSVKRGAQEITSERFFFLPADIPLVPETVYKQLFSEHGKIIIPTYRERKGHPVLFHQSITKEILNEPDTSNLRNVIRQRDYKMVAVENEEILLDLDSLSDYDVLQRILDQKSHG